MTNAVASRRPVSTTHMSDSEGLDLLNSQRSLRPSSPHFTIYVRARTPQLLHHMLMTDAFSASFSNLNWDGLAVSPIE